MRRPSDARRYESIFESNSEDIDRAVEGSWRAFQESSWAKGPPRERAAILRRWADLIDADAELLGPLEAVGSTRPISDVKRFDIPFTAEGIRFFAGCDL